MRFSKINILLLGFIALFFASCKSDDPDDGFFKVGDNIYYVNEAVLQNVGTDNGYYQLRLTMDNSNNNEPHSINFLFYSEVKDYLPSGIYIPYAYDDVYNHRFKRGAWLDGDVEAGVILLGKVKVTKTNDDYTIQIIDCKDSNNNVISGEYKGKVKVTY